MALDAADWTVSVAGDIRWTGSGTATNVTVLEMHRFLQDLADDAVAVAATSDLLAITEDTPSDRATDNIITLINGYNIDDTAAQHIFDGSITQGAGVTEETYAGLVVVGSVEAGTEIQVEQAGSIFTSFWGVLGSVASNPDATNAAVLLRVMIKVRQDGANIDGRRLRVYARELGDTYAEFAVTMGAGNNTAALFTGVDLNNATVAGTIVTWDQFDNIEGFQNLVIGGTGYDFYSQWTLAAGGGTTPASPTINDLYEWGKYVSRRGSTTTLHGFTTTGEKFRGITHQWAYDAEAGDEAPATNDDYAWGTFLDTGAITGTFQLGEKVTGGTSTAYGRILSIDTTNESMVVATESGTWQNAEVVTGTTSAATATTSAAPVGQATGGGLARILAVDDGGTTGTVWVQLIQGTIPADNAICYKEGAANHDDVIVVNGAVTSRTLGSSFLGVSTGSAIIGAFGVGFDPDDLTASDQLFDLTNTLRVPPNNVTWTITGLVSGEDRVLVGPRAAGVLDVAQDTINGALTGAAVTSVVTTGSIPLDTPTSGTLRIEADDGRYLRVPFSSYTGSTYTIPSFDFSGTNNCATTNNIYISYVDELASGTTAAFTSVFQSTRDLFVRVRDGGGSPIKTFETPSQLTNAGGGASAIRTTDA